MGKKQVDITSKYLIYCGVKVNVEQLMNSIEYDIECAIEFLAGKYKWLSAETSIEMANNHISYANNKLQLIEEYRKHG